MNKSNAFRKYCKKNFKEGVGILMQIPVKSLYDAYETSIWEILVETFQSLNMTIFEYLEQEYGLYALDAKEIIDAEIFMVEVACSIVMDEMGVLKKTFMGDETRDAPGPRDDKRDRLNEIYDAVDDRDRLKDELK